MPEKVEEKATFNNNYKNTKGLTRKEIKKLSASEIVWYINYLSKDNRTHVLWEDCVHWLEFKMKEIKKLVSYLENKKPKDMQ